jgi:RNA recognition motif-containing protein
MNIFVGNLSLETNAEDLRKEFKSFGVVLSVIVMNDKYIGSGQSSGYGYVEMASKSDGASAVAKLDGKRLRNRTITVIEALPLSEKHIDISTYRIGWSNRKRGRKCVTS